MTVIVYAANEAAAFIQKAKLYARRLFAEDNPKVLVRHAPAYDPKQHEAADVIIVDPQYESIIAAHEDEARDVRVIVATEAQLEQRLNPEPAPAPDAKAATPKKERTAAATPTGASDPGAKAGRP